MHDSGSIATRELLPAVELDHVAGAASEIPASVSSSPQRPDSVIIRRTIAHGRRETRKPWVVRAIGPWTASPAKMKRAEDAGEL
jgi:hypothetical protein